MATLDTVFLHLGSGATAVPQPPFTGSDWYMDYAGRTAADGADGRLVSQFTFDGDWDSWEMHPHGEEVVVCTAGAMTLHQEMADGTTATVRLVAGEFAVNPRGCWHTADIDGSATALFITAGLATEGRPR